MSAKLDQYREKYPLYKSVADDVLARALHGKYYSDVPFDKFAEKIGLPGLPDLTPAPLIDQVSPDQELDPIDYVPTGTPRQNARRGLSRTGKQLLPGAGRAKENQALEAADAAGFTPKSTVEAKTPEELRQERIARLENDRARLEQGAREAAPRSAGEVVTDYGLEINQGFKEIPGSLVKVANKDRGTGLTPQNEFFLSLGANVAGKLGSTRAQELADRLAANTKPHSEFLQSFADQADEQAADAGERMSPRAKALGREFSEAEGIGGKAAFLAANPGFLADLTVQSAPFIATGGVAGKAVGAVAGLEAGIGANLATQGVMSAASSSEEAKAYVLGIPKEELEQLPEYKRLSGQYRPEQIRKILAEKASDTGFAAGLLANAVTLGSTAKLSVVERAMLGGKTGATTGSRAGNAGIGATKEFTQEGFQGAGEQVATNVGQMTADNRVGLTDKVGEAAFVEGIVGAGPGGLAGFSQATSYDDSEVGRAKRAYDTARTPTERGKANTELIIAQAKAKMAKQGAPVVAPVVEPVQPAVPPLGPAPVVEPVVRPEEQDVQPEVDRQPDGVPLSTVEEQDQTEDDELSSLMAQAFQEDQPEIPADREPEPKTESAGVGAIYRIPVDQLTLSPDLPQFKDGANEHGEVEPLGGTFDERGVGPIQVWRRLNGALEVISGRHRLGLQRRSGGKDISAQVYNEADGFTLADAATLDAELNIRDGQGKVKDYVGYFGGKQITEEEADARGLLARATGRRAFTIANKGSPDLIAAHGVDKLSDDAATQIAEAAPNDDRMQALGMKSVQDGKSIGLAVNTMRAVKMLLGDSPPGSVDMFGHDDSAMREAEKMAEFAHKKQRELSDRLNAITGAAKRPEMAKREGVDIRDKQALQKRIGELKADRAAWDHWDTDQGLIAQIRDGIADGVKFSRTSSGVVEEAPSAEGIEVGEVSDSDAAKYFMPKEEVDSITEGLSVLAKNPKLFRRRLFNGKNMKYIARDGGLNRTNVSREEGIDEDTHEPRMETTHTFAVDQSGKSGVAKIIETDGKVWVDVSGMRRGRGNAEGVYSAAASLAFNTGRDFVEDPNGLSDDAMYRRTVHELSAILKRGDAKNVPAGPFLTSGRKGGPATTPIGKNEARDYNVAVRDRALAIHANTLLAIPEAANVHFDADSNRFTDPDGNVLSDGDLDRLAEHRQANPVGSAMVRGPRKSGGKRAAPVGSTSIKVFAIVEALKRAPTGPARTRLVERLRGIAASSDGLAQLTGILPSKVVGQSGGLTVEAVRNVVVKAFGKRAKKLIADGKLKIVKSETGVPDSIRQSAEPLSSADGTVQGFFDPASGDTYLLADNLADEASARAVMLHEEGVHAGLAEMIGPARINALADILDRLEKTGTKADQETIAAAKKRVSDAGTEAKHRAEETVAYTVEIEEKNTDPSPMFRKVITRAHTAIRQWALRRGMGDLTVADIRQLAIGGLEYRSRGQRVGGAAKVPGSRATFFSKRAEYVGTHAAPMVDSGAPAHQLNGEFGYPDDIYSPQGPRYYGTGLADLDKRAFAVVNRIRGNPDADVTVYRAVPNTVDGDTINPGDWVSIVHAYAKDHGEGPLGGEYRIISRVVKAKDIFTNGDSIQEWGYDPQDDVADVPARGPMFSKAAKPLQAGTFYSALSASIADLPAKRMSADGWVQQIRSMVNNGKVKQDEVEWSGLTDWLGLQDGPVAKDQITGYLDANGVRVDETVLVGAGVLIDELGPFMIEEMDNAPTTAEGWMDASVKYESLAQSLRDDGDEQEADRLFRMAELMNDMAERLEFGSGLAVNAAKFDKYTIPGGDNYREVLLKIPPNTETVRHYLVSLPNGGFAGPYNSLVGANERIAEESDPAKRAMMKVHDRGVRAELRPPSKYNSGQFNSPHFDQPNILAHIRVNDRTDADGKRVLFVEEVQSDWGQAGKKQGFAKADITHPIVVFNTKTGETLHRFRTSKEAESYIAEHDSAMKLLDYEDTTANGGQEKDRLPSAPFVTKTDKWLTLALKRVIKMAVDGGYDKVAFVTGEQSAARYDLSKQVDYIDYVREGPDTYRMAVVGKDGQGVNLPKETFTASELENYVGKDVAQRIVNGEGQSGGGRMTLRGPDLKVGGEGMRAFYDRIVPNTLNSLLKKVGGGKVTPIEARAIGAHKNSDGKEFADQNVVSVPITDSIREKVSGGVPLFSKKAGTPATKDLFGNAPSETAQGLADREAKIDAKLNGGGKVVKPSEGPGDLFGGPRELTKDMFGNQETLFSKVEQKTALAATTRRMIAEAKKRREEAEAIITAVRVAESDIKDVAIRNERLSALADRAHRMVAQWGESQEIREQIADANRDLARLRGRALAGDRTALKQFTEAEKQATSLRDDLAKAMAAKQKAITAIDRMNTLGGKIDAMDMVQYRTALVAAADAASAVADKARSVADWWRSRDVAVRDATERSDTKRRAIARDYGINGPSMLWEYDPTRFDGASGWLHSLREKYQAKFLTFLDAQKDIEAATGQLVADSQNVWRAENLMHGRVENQLKGLEASYTKKIKEHLRKTGALALVEDFMEARAAPARNIDVAKKRPDMPDGGSGMTTAEAKAFLSGKAKGLRSGQELTDGLREQIMPVVRLLDAMRNETLLRLKTTGQITDAVYETLKANTSYAPLRGKNGEPVEGSGLGGTGFDVRGNPIKRALGRGTGNRATNIVAELIGDAEKSIVNGERLRVGKTLARLVLANPNKALWEVERVELEAKYSEAADVVYYGLKNLDQESIRFVEKGVPYKITLKDPRMRAAIKNLSPSQLDKIVKFMGALNRYFSAVFTRYNPFFVPINMARDLGMGLISVYAEHGASVAADVAIHYGSAMRAVWRAERGKPVANKYHTYFNEMSEAGGTTAFSQLRNVGDIASHIESDVKTIFQLTREGKPHKAIARVIRESSIVKLVGDVNEAVENAVRLSAYVAIRERGASISKAAEYAKEITVNFNRRGSETSFVNSIILFFNASVQGSTRVLQLMKNPKAVASVTAMGALQFAFAALAMSDEDDDGQTAWDKISEYEKARNFIIAIPSVRDGQMYVKTIKIPVPYGFNLFTYAGGKLAQAMMSKDKFDTAKFTNDMTVAAVDSISPLKFTEGWDSIKPQVVRVFDAKNQNLDNFGRRITNEVHYSDFERPRAYLGRASTPSYFVAAAKGLNWLGGGDEVTPPKVLKGLLDHSPEDLQFLAESFGGGLLKAVDQFGQLGSMVASGVEVRPHEVPVLNRLYSEVTPEQATANRYRTAKEEIAREKDRVKAAFYQRGEKAAEKVIADTPELKGTWLHRFKTTNDVRDKAGRIRLNAGPGTLVDIKRIADKEIRRIGDEQEAVYNDPKLSMSQRINAIRRLQAEREKVQRKVTIKFKETKR